MPPRARIRPARLEEQDHVALCVRAAYSKYVGRIGREPAPMLADYAALIRRGAVYVLAEGDTVAGVLVVEPVGDAVLVENVAVCPPYQGMGLGRQLMQFVEEFAYENDLRKVSLYTNEQMTENIAFYEKLGYREIDRRLDDGYRRVFMSKELAEKA